MTSALVSIAALLALMAVGLPIAFAMLIVGFAGLVYVLGWTPAAALVAQTTLDAGQAYELSVVPLFILMGSLVARAGIADDLYVAANVWLGRFRGGLAMATIVACGLFSAMSGSSLATAATMAKVAMPPMKRYGYQDSIAAGSIAAGGTIGILIPPSVVMIVYGLLTETDIGKLFVAGIVPGLITIAGYMAAIWLTAVLKPGIAPRGEATSFLEKLAVTRRVWMFALLLIVVIGGIYLGVFTPTESAGIGAFGAFLLAIVRARLRPAVVLDILRDAAGITTMLFFVLIGALIYTAFLNLAGFSYWLSEAITGLGLTQLELIFILMAGYVVLGMFLESMSLIILTIPIVFPIVQAAGIDPVWFGIFVVVLTEVSLITPPVGMNIFVLRSVLPEVGFRTICAGLIPFYVADIIRILIFLFVPMTVMFLPLSMH
ncbi:TRAP transporter large permease [Microbaculum marinisediminis]|uniref:TRAP transporter large permease protein n=1 Tax=Microbaculum marinisediminis TaxID=2931392 RepID=A0AAW5R4E6_9HYPH|nr:TRAP transporter large permease [Microbaculum sp. A6E488]MCT8973489.1 TRAP transporter large permease [Microbaculum sp. A6E488]